MVYISAALRQEIIDRAHSLCEYCQTALLMVVTMEIDHIVPLVVGGETHRDNLCLVCRGCNSFKQDFQSGIDPETNLEEALFNPRTRIWHEHFAWNPDGVVLIGLTSTGRATIQRLRINRPGMIASRKIWVQASWHPPHPGQFPFR